MIAEKFNGHLVFEKLEQIKNRLQENGVREKIQLDLLSFFDSAIEYILERVNSTIPVLVQETELNALTNEIESGLREINNFIGNKNQGHLTNASNNINSALNRARNFPLPLSKSKYNFSKEIANFEKTVSEKYAQLLAENMAFDERLKKLNFTIESKQQELDKLNQLLVQKQAEITNLTNTFTTDYNNIKSAANQQFENEKAKFRQEFNAEKQNFVNEKNTLKKEFNTDRKSYENQIEELKKNISLKTENLVKDLENKLVESKKLVNIIGNVGATGNYQIIADYHKKQANVWRWIALFFMVLLTGLLIYTIYHVTGTSFNWQVTIVRIVAFSVLLYPATYAARESSKHRRLENFNRKSELDIASINPFIEILPEERKQAIKERMVEKFFGNSKDFEEDEKKDNSEELTVSGFERLIKALIPLLKR